MRRKNSRLSGKERSFLKERRACRNPDPAIKEREEDRENLGKKVGGLLMCGKSSFSKNSSGEKKRLSSSYQGGRQK